MAAALRAAQRERADDGAYAWAGLIVLGDGEIVPLPGGSKRAALPAGLLLGASFAALLLGAGGVVWWRRRKTDEAEAC